MSMQQCPNGHIYDDANNQVCPYCNSGKEVLVTVPLTDDINQMVPPTGMYEEALVPEGGSEVPPTCALNEDDFVSDKTVFVMAQDSDFEEGPITGWLICMEGSRRGKDFRLHFGKNRIGRGSEERNLEVNLDFDSTVSRGVNATLSYDERNNKFYLAAGESKNNIYINNTLLLVPVEVKDYDVIEIGTTKLVFRSFCSEKFSWKSEEKQA